MSGQNNQARKINKNVRAKQSTKIINYIVRAEANLIKYVNKNHDQMSSTRNNQAAKSVLRRSLFIIKKQY